MAEKPSASNRRLQQYLAKIQNGTPINLESFLKTLPEHVRRRHHKYFHSSKLSQQRWLVTPINQEMVDYLTQTSAPVSTRHEGALKGDSHRQNTQSALVLAYHEHLNDARPDVVVINGSDVTQEFAPKPTALVIENEDNFTQWQAMLRFAETCLGQSMDLRACDVVLGGGNRVLRPQVSQWLKQYDQVLCAFDYDLGGLKAYQGLQKALDRQPVWVEPHLWDEWLPLFQKSPQSPKRLVKAIELAERLGLTGLKDAFSTTKRFMEQESLLNDK